MTDWRSAQQKAARTAKWAVTMTKVRIRRTLCKTTWQLVTFNGPAGAESVGIVDLLAVRKNHRPGKNGLKRGDLLEIIIIQVKGGSARFPTFSEIERLQTVSKTYNSKAVLLGQWKPGRQVEFFQSRAGRTNQWSRPSEAWKPLESLAEVFH